MNRKGRNNTHEQNPEIYSGKLKTFKKNPTEIVIEGLYNHLHHEPCPLEEKQHPT